ncbi:MAG: methyltransferase [Spirochaetales bacterium]|nr:methyltransferase [Spirochaetales bacterium]
MNSRERVLSAINHRQPDRLPVDLGATPSSGISALAYKNLIDYLGIDGKAMIYDVVQQLALPEAAVMERLGVDVIDIAQAFRGGDDDWYPITMRGGKEGYYPSWFRPVQGKRGQFDVFHRDGELIASMPEGAGFFDQTFFPWKDGYPDSRSAMEEAIDEAMDKVLWQNLAHSPWDRVGEPDFWNTLKVKTKVLRDESDKALLIVCGCNLFEWGTFLRRMDNFLMDLYIDKKNVAMLLEILMERHMKTLENVCAAVGDSVDIIRFGDDLGMDSGPFMGLDIYRELFHEHRSRLCSFVHENSSMHTFLHTCGSVYQYLPSLIDEGIEIINPVQTNCRDMQPERLKAEFGDDLVFWGGGADPREILNNGTPDEVRRDVLSRLEVFAPGGGYVFNSIHNILSDVPPENIMAAFGALEIFNGRNK